MRKSCLVAGSSARLDASHLGGLGALTFVLFEERSQNAENQLEQIDHQAASSPVFLASRPNAIFGTHRPPPCAQ
jgi:hypothetical protein